MSLRRPRFSGHQTFSFRYGWLEKGCQHIKDGRKFSDPDALVHLGVGKNMVSSIQYWCDVFDLASDGKGVHPFGKDLLDRPDGWDPYLEDDASLWLLHWKLCSQQEFETAVSILFGEMHKPEFSREDWMDLLCRRGTQKSGKNISQPTLERDIECSIKMYVPSSNEGKKRVLELSFACPFQELGLLSTLERGTRLRFAIGPKSGLAPEIIGYAIWDYMHRFARVGRSQSASADSYGTAGTGMSLRDLVYADYAPGQIFMLDENSIVEAILQLMRSVRWNKYFNLTASEGIETVHCSLRAGEELLNAYYLSKE